MVEADEQACELLKSTFLDAMVLTADATVWIKDCPDASFDIFTASWVIHNFPEDQRELFLKEAARVLRPGGLIVLFDKVLPDDKHEIERLWKVHVERLLGLDRIGKGDLKNEMLSHEERDAEKPFVWYESELNRSFSELGFKELNYLVRFERDVVVSAINKAR